MIGRSLRRFTAAIILIALSAGPIAGNEIIQYEYDALARISTACYVLQDKLVTYTYDAAGNRTAVTTTNGVCGATTFAIENPTPVLAGTALNFSVRRHGSTSATNAVNYATANGTAVAGTHYTAKSGNLSFSIGQTVKNVTVNTTSGSIPSGSRSMVVNLSSATGGATITTSQAAGVINANTAFKIENAAPVTQGSTLSFTVRRIGATGGTNAVSYATANGTAIAGTHYTAKSGTLSFTSGQTVKTVTVNTTSGSFPSGSRTMYVNLSNPTNGAGIDVAQGSGVMTVPPNNPPVAVNDTHSGYYYVFTNVPVYVLTNDSDPDNDPLTITSATCLSTGCSVTVVGGQYLMVMGTTPIFKDVRYWISDGRGGTANAVARVSEFYQDPGCGEFEC